MVPDSGTVWEIEMLNAKSFVNGEELPVGESTLSGMAYMVYNDASTRDQPTGRPRKGGVHA